MTHATIAVRLQPRASREELLGVRDGALVARVSAPPVDGRANRALCRLVARRLSIAPSRVTLVGGERARQKLLRVEGIDAPTLHERLRGDAPG
jgi:uncharacterized protein